ncbi:MAG: hypothetical protein ACLFM1_04655 [Bacteroidales bacterium]
MAKLLFEGAYKSNMSEVKIKLLIVHFKDNTGVHILYSPHLDLSGYGENLSAAKESFEITLSDFIDYTIKKKTIGSVLRKLGWSFDKGKVKNPKKVMAPSIASVINDNDHVSEIFDNYPVETFHKNITIPAFA